MREVVKKEIVKWLDAGIIYPILDNKWINLTQVVPKKSDITVVKNEKVNCFLLAQHWVGKCA